MPAVRALERMNLVLCDGGLHNRNFSHLMTVGIRIISVELCSAVCAGRRSMMHHPATFFRGNQRASPLWMTELTSPFSVRLRLRGSDRLLRCQV